MEHLKVAELIEALNFVGRILRSKDGSKPADAVTKVIQQLDGPDMTLSEWAEIKQKKPIKPSRKSTKANVDEQRVRHAAAQLNAAVTQVQLRAAIGGLTLSAGELQMLAKTLTGKSGRSGKAALEIVETHYSNRLLLQDRVDGVKRLFG